MEMNPNKTANGSLIYDIYRYLEQTQFAGAGDSFSAPLYLQLVKDDPAVPFDGAQGEEQAAR